jgi:hypothetical protein
MRERSVVQSATRHFHGGSAFLAYREVRRTLLEKIGIELPAYFHKTLVSSP